MKTMLVMTMDRKKALTNTKAAIQNLSMHLKVVTVTKMTTITNQTTPTDKELAIKCRMKSNKK